MQPTKVALSELMPRSSFRSGSVLYLDNSCIQSFRSKLSPDLMAKSVDDGLALPMYIVDAFTEQIFSGNQAAVCLVRAEQAVTDETMQRLGAEMNLSETAFVIADKGNFEDAKSFGIRWFTPTTEIDLCGHATLASAAVLFFKKGNNNDAIAFHSRSGELIVSRDENGRIFMDFPANPPVEMDVALRITSPFISVSRVSAPRISLRLHNVVSPSPCLSSS
ncbi:phenazine biosynthesis-like domain-containing protein [Plakobranchus ocellatus]|uniref:Phenazine biosynthesis-like domain-containing protein n=1 Tax=Plakobranchus ocellatus TaxID=259542 RepID=A0AAV4C3B6_9GAST|nr:phenazine biosynthesis-like domain-containing protein [Plakobranchus ocellatus]